MSNLKIVPKVKEIKKSDAVVVTVSVNCSHCKEEQSVNISDYMESDRFEPFCEYDASCESCENDFIFEVRL